LPSVQRRLAEISFHDCDVFLHGSLFVSLEIGRRLLEAANRFRWSRIYVIGRMGEAILTRLRPASSRASAFVLGLFVYYILAIIPIVGWLVVPLAILFALGAELIARKQFYVTARSQDLI
jgi:hypothetical protein